MSNIIAVTKSNKEIIVENFVSNASKALQWWSRYGMQNVKYKAVKVKFIPKEL